MEMPICEICNNSCDGKFHHIFCLDRLLREQHPEAVDMQGSSLSVWTLIMFNTMQTSSVELGWQHMEIRSHPSQKRQFNSGILSLKSEYQEAYKASKRFLKDATWETDEDMCPLMAIINGQVVIGLGDAYEKGKSVTAKWSMTHPIQGGEIKGVI